MGTSSIYNDREDYKPTPLTPVFNGINSSAGYTVGQNGGINRTNQPYSIPHSSGIYTVRIEAPQKKGDIFTTEKGDTHRKHSNTFRGYKRLHIHRLDAIVETGDIDKDTVARDLLRLLNYETHKTKTTSGKAFTTWVYREKRGETITISLNHKTNTYTVRITTHKTQRLIDFLDYTHTILGVDKIKALMIETYIRYLERYELRVAKAIEALNLQIGKSLKQHLIPSHGKHDYYLSRAKLEYRGATVVVKTYRHKTYRQHKPTHAEYHPKIEQLTIIKEVPITIDLDKTIREYSTLLHTILHTVNPRVILGDYENETETIEVYTIDPQIEKYIRGITKRLKAEIILEEQYPDKRLAIARLLVDKKMKISEISRLLGYSKRHVHRIIEELVESGVIKRVKRGVYEYTHTRPQLEKKRVIESRHMTLPQAIDFIKETRAKITHDHGTLVLEYEDDYTIRRVIVSSILVEEKYIVETIAGRKTIYRIPRNRLRQLL